MTQSNTDDGINHGSSILEDCLEAIIERFEDGYILCPILWSDGKCEDCYTALLEREI